LRAGFDKLVEVVKFEVETMQTNIQEIYQQNILPLPDSEQLKLASLILEKVTKQDSGGKAKNKGSIRELFGSVSLGYATGADNESIDADLAKAYMDTHEDED
jgi:uncharacterized protein YqgQ